MRLSFAAVAAVFIVSASDTIDRSHAFSINPSSSVSFRTPPPATLATKTNRIDYKWYQQQQKKQTQMGGWASSIGRTLQFTEMSGGMEELHELTENKARSLIEKQVQKSPSLWKIAGYATIPVSAALGFGIVPSRLLAAHAAGAIATGVAGAIGKSKLDAVAESAALPAIAQVIIDHGLDDPVTTNRHINSLKESHGIIEDDDFQAMCADVYSKYLLGMIKYSPMPKSSEPKELGKLKFALGLSNLLVGESHAAAAEEWYRTTCYFTPEDDLDDPDHPDRQTMDKFLFLTERALKQGGETHEAFQFEMARVAKAMKLSLLVAMDRVAEVQEPFYARALKSTRAKLGSGQVSEAMLERARQTLGIDNETAYDMNVVCFNEEIRSQLGLNHDEDDESSTDIDKSNLKFGEKSKEKLYLLRDILGLTEEDAAWEIYSEVTPLYEVTALASLKSLLSGIVSPDDAWEQIEIRRKELLLPESSSNELLSSVVTQSLGDLLEKTNKFAKVNNEVAVYENILEALDAKEAFIGILLKSGWADVDSFYDIFCNPWEKESANGFLSVDDRIKIFKIFMNRSVFKSGGKTIDDETFDQIKEVKGLLAISDSQLEIETHVAFAPELQKAFLSACDEIVHDYTPELAKNMEKKINETIDHYRFSDDFIRVQGTSYYAKAVAQINNQSPGGIPTTEMNEALEALRKIYRLKNEDTYSSHLEYFGETYKKSILEAMGSTGIIRAELQQGLSELRERLGVRKEDTERLFLEAIKKKFIPMVQWINDEIERTQLSQKQLSQRRGKDMGEDVFQTGKSADGTLGLGAEVNIMGDMMNLVDFYTENSITEEKGIGTKELDGEEVPVLETSYPITAIGSDAIDEQMAEYLYRQFVVGAFTSQGEQAGRYESARATFGGILGLTSKKMEEINDDIGSKVYDNFVARTMAQKGSLDQQDMMFLANIQTKLGLSSEQGEKLMMQSQKKVLSEEINKIMDKPTAEAIKHFREKCNVMGMDLREDVGVSAQRLVRMFESEIIPTLKSGEISIDNIDSIFEIQDSLNMDPDECETVLEKTVLSLGKDTLNLVSRELLRGREDNTVEAITQLVRYAAFLEGELDLTVEEPIAWKIFNIYEALDLSRVDEETVEENKKLLKTALGIAGKDYI